MQINFPTKDDEGSIELNTPECKNLSEWVVMNGGWPAGLETHGKLIDDIAGSPKGDTALPVHANQVHLTPSNVGKKGFDSLLNLCRACTF